MATRRAMPVLQVRDVARARSFYARLGFAPHDVWHDPESGAEQFCIVQRGDVTIALQRLAQGQLRVNTHWAAYVYVDDVDGLAKAFEVAGVPPERAPEDAPYGCRDFDIRDPDGHLIAFGQALNPHPSGPGLQSDRGAG